MTWQVLTCVSVVFFSGAMLLQRRLLHHHKCEPYAFVVVSQALVGVVTFVYALSHGFSMPNIHTLWLPMLGSIVLHGIGYITHAKALQTVQASVFSVFYATQSIWIMLVGLLFFGEHLQMIQIVGVVLILGSVCLLVYEAGTFRSQPGTVLGLLTGLLFGFAVTCWAYVGRQVDPVSWAAIGFWGVALTAFLLRPRAVWHIPTMLSRKVLPQLLLLAGMFSIGGVTLLVAYSLGDLSTVSPLRQMSIVVTVLLAMLFIPQERTQPWRKFAVSVLCMLGAVLICM